MRRISVSVSLLTVALATAAFSQPAAADTYYWVGGQGAYDDKNKWTRLNPGADATFPGINDDAKIWANNAIVNINYGKSQSVKNLDLWSGSVLNINGSILADENILNNGSIVIKGKLTNRKINNTNINGNGIIVLDYGSIASQAVGGGWIFGSGQYIFGSGNISAGGNIVNNGVIRSDVIGGGITIDAAAITGTGSFVAVSGASITLLAPTRTANIANGNGGEFRIGNNSVTVGRDYQNGNFGRGNAFNPRAGIVGTGPINAVDARQTVSGDRLANGVIDLGPARVGQTVSASITIGNSGTETVLRGAVQNKSAPWLRLSSTDFVLSPGASHNSNIHFTATTPGILSGQTIDIVNNFDNVANHSLAVTATVTDLAVAQLAKAAGVGLFSGAGDGYTLDLGSFRADSGTRVTTEIAVLNAVLGSDFAETLGGGFTQWRRDAGYSGFYNAFIDLAGGNSTLGTRVTFDTSGLGAGVYESVLFFDGFSRFAGLDDLALGPIWLNVRATVTGVPEPASWAMLIAGFGLVGGALRRQRMAAMA